MRVLLVNPPFREIYGKLKLLAPIYPPLGLEYIAAVLENHGYEVKITDMTIENITEKNMCIYLKNLLHR
jgi:hypothetical protein